MKIFHKEKQKCAYADHKTTVGKVWHFLAHEDTWLSFIVDAILVVVIGKFLLYPGIGLALGTAYPAVAVVSNSMDHHDQDFDTWWTVHASEYKQYNITKEDFSGFIVKNGFKKGDVLIIIGTSVKDIEVGDVIVYKTADRSDPIIHRVVTKSNTAVSTKGDANSDQISFEKNLTNEKIKGKAILKIPYVGWVKVGLADLLKG